MKGQDLAAYSTYRWIMNAPDLEAERGRGATFQERPDRIAPTPRPYPPMPMLFATVVASSVGLLALAVFGAFTLVRAVFGSD